MRHIIIGQTPLAEDRCCRSWENFLQQWLQYLDCSVWYGWSGTGVTQSLLPDTNPYPHALHCLKPTHYFHPALHLSI